MGRTTVKGLCVAAVVAIAAFAVTANAMAAAPEFGRCVKKSKKEGAGYTDSKCVRGVSSGAKYEWIAGPGAKTSFTWIERFVFSKKHRQCELALSEEQLAKEAREAAATASEPEKGKLEKLAEVYEAEAEEHYQKAGNLSPAQCESALKSEEPKAPAVLEVKGLRRVICAGLNGTGEYTGANTTALKFALTECALNTGKGETPFPCTSSGAKEEGEIVTSELKGELGLIEKGSQGVKAVVGIDYSAMSGAFAEFACGPYTIKLTGSVIGHVRSVKAQKLEKFKFGQSKGNQNVKSFEGALPDVLESSINGGPETTTGLTLRGDQTNEENVEVNSVV